MQRRYWGVLWTREEGGRKSQEPSRQPCQNTVSWKAKTVRTGPVQKQIFPPSTPVGKISDEPVLYKRDCSIFVFTYAPINEGSPRVPRSRWSACSITTCLPSSVGFVSNLTCGHLTITGHCTWTLCRNTVRFFNFCFSIKLSAGSNSSASRQLSRILLFFYDNTRAEWYNWLVVKQQG